MYVLLNTVFMFLRSIRLTKSFAVHSAHFSGIVKSFCAPKLLDLPKNFDTQTLRGESGGPFYWNDTTSVLEHQHNIPEGYLLHSTHCTVRISYPVTVLLSVFTLQQVHVDIPIHFTTLQMNTLSQWWNRKHTINTIHVYIHTINTFREHNTIREMILTNMDGLNV